MHAAVLLKVCIQALLVALFIDQVEGAIIHHNNRLLKMHNQA